MEWKTFTTFVLYNDACQSMNMQKRVNVITLGCSKNLSDSEVLLGQLNHAGLAAASEMRDDHDIVVVNTCGFIDLAKEESVETILHQVERKKAGEIP